MGPSCRLSPETLRLSSDRPITNEARKLETEEGRAAVSYVRDSSGTFAQSSVVASVVFLLMTSQSSSICRPGLMPCPWGALSSLLAVHSGATPWSEQGGWKRRHRGHCWSQSRAAPVALSAPGGWEGGQGSSPARQLRPAPHRRELGAPSHPPPCASQGALPEKAA